MNFVFAESQPSTSKRSLPSNVRAEGEEIELLDFDNNEVNNNEPELSDSNLPDHYTVNENKKMKLEILPVNIQQPINDKIISAFPTASSSELGEAEIALNNIFVGLIKSKQKIPMMAVAGNSLDTEMHGLCSLIFKRLNLYHPSIKSPLENKEKIKKNLIYLNRYKSAIGKLLVFGNENFKEDFDQIQIEKFYNFYIIPIQELLDLLKNKIKALRALCLSNQLDSITRNRIIQAEINSCDLWTISEQDEAKLSALAYKNQRPFRFSPRFFRGTRQSYRGRNFSSFNPSHKNYNAYSSSRGSTANRGQRARPYNRRGNKS